MNIVTTQLNSNKRDDLRLGSVLQQEDVNFQSTMLDGVSRTFALTIPRLPLALRDVISNAYLLCRIIDTIEDEPSLTFEQKQSYCELFIDILQSEKDSNMLTSQLAPLLSEHTIPAEHDLIRKLHKVVRITKSFHPDQQKALLRCVRIMSEGMVYFQQHASERGLPDMKEMDKYCYHVAGVVGEMLTELFSFYSNEIAEKKAELFELSSSFGQGLQMTNILKDIWDDKKRGVCWLPRNLFEEKGLFIIDINHHAHKQDFHQVMQQLIRIAHTHLENALRYTLIIPGHEKGIREFCLWALGMAMLTLRKINKNLGYTNSDQVKISRNSVKATVMVVTMSVKQDVVLKSLFRLLGNGLPGSLADQPAAP